MVAIVMSMQLDCTKQVIMHIIPTGPGCTTARVKKPFLKKQDAEGKSCIGFSTSKLW